MSRARCISPTGTLTPRNLTSRNMLSNTLLSAATILLASTAHAAALSVQVSDSNGQPVADAVVYAESTSGKPVESVIRTVSIEQVSRKFLPLVSVIQTGSSVLFPNNDTVRHHVYSFSPVKTFELKLYSGNPSNPVVFDKAGNATIGCNIHDNMIAYVKVVDTPYFGKTDSSGQVRIDAVPPGEFRLKTWHYRQANPAAVVEQALTLKAEGASAAMRLDLTAPATGK